MTTVTPNACLCPDPYSLKHITNHESLSFHASTLVMILPRRSFMSLRGILNTLLLRYSQRKKKSLWVKSGGLSGHSGSWFNVITCKLWLKSSHSLSLTIMCWWAGAPSCTKCLKALRFCFSKYSCKIVRDTFFIYHLEIPVTIEIAFDGYKEIVFTISPMLSSPNLNLQQMFKPYQKTEKTSPWSVIAKVVQRHLSKSLWNHL